MEKLQDQTESMYMTLLRLEAGGDSKNRSAVEQRIERSLKALAAAQDKADQLEEQLSYKELVLEQLRKKQLQQQVMLEELEKDPDLKRRRALSKNVVRLTECLDGILGSLSQYEIDLNDLSIDHVNILEAKLDAVHRALKDRARTAP